MQAMTSPLNQSLSNGSTHSSNPPNQPGYRPPLGSAGNSSGPSSYTASAGMNSFEGGQRGGYPPNIPQPQVQVSNEKRFQGAELVMLYDYQVKRYN